MIAAIKWFSDITECDNSDQEVYSANVNDGAIPVVDSDKVSDMVDYFNDGDDEELHDNENDVADMYNKKDAGEVYNENDDDDIIENG